MTDGPKNHIDILPVSPRGGWDVFINSSSVPNQSISFNSKVPISWIVLVSYGYVLNDPDRLGNAPTMCWFRGDTAGGSPQFFYTSFDYFGALETVFKNQSIVPYFGRAYKVYGKTITTYLQLASGFRSQMIVNAYPQIYGAAKIEAPETSILLVDNVKNEIPDWASHIGIITDVVTIGMTISFFDRANVLVPSLTIGTGTLSPGQYIQIPTTAVTVMADGGDAWIGFKYFGVV